MEPQEILTELESSEPGYRRTAVHVAMKHGEAVVPLLIKHLEQLLEDPESFCAKDYPSRLPLYAVSLLGHHRAPEAHQLLVALASLPGETPFELFGDGVHELFPLALWKTSGGNPALLMALVKNPAANEYCRAGAIRALAYGVAEHCLERADVIHFLQGLFTGEEATRDEPMVWNGAAAALGDMWPGESMEVLQGAYDDGLVDSFYISFGSIEARHREGREQRLAAFERRALSELTQTPHEQLEAWECFTPPGRPRDPPRTGPHVGKERRRAAKKARQQARTARKQQRRARRRRKG